MNRRLSRLAFGMLEIAFTLVFLSAVAHHVGRLDFKPLAAMTVPLLVVFYGFASVLFVRGRALLPGPWQTRSLYAAVEADLRLPLFVLPYAFMQAGLIFFMRALWAIAPDFFAGAGMLAMARRVSAASATINRDVA